jgi:asparagine synthase (glutamine-hydrolysing)
MCGIAGIVNRQAERVDPTLLRAMAERLRHRGPDAVGVQALGAAGLAHARLAIIDLAGGAQPMANEDGTVWVTFAGEILNFVELREELRGSGHRFATRSDTEVIVHAYEEWGPSCVTRFNGQWAFALFDARDETLLLSRDRFGIRPLYYAAAPKQLVFASEVKAIFCHPEIERAVDLEGLDDILTFWCTIAPRTFFRGVRELPPGHSLTMRDGELRVSRYYDLDYPTDASRSEADFAEELRALLVDAVALRLDRSDVPVGAYLSGGLDSTAVTAIVHQRKEAFATFSVTFADAEFDESRFQDEVIRHLGVRDHHAAHCRAEDIGRVFPDVVWHAEQPIVRTAPAPLYLLAERVRAHGTRVVLTGEGADELLGGYDLFKEAKVRRFCARRPESSRRTLLFRRLYPYLTRLQRQPPSMVAEFFRARPEDLASPFFSHLLRWEMTAACKRFYSDETRAALGARDPSALVTLPAAYAGWDPFCQSQYLETTQLLGGYLLSSQGDRMMMAHGVEGRFPFLDVRLAELAARIPPRFKMRGLDEKHVLKRAVADLVPPFLMRRPKQPYRAPDAACFFEPTSGAARFAYVEELLSPRALAATGLFDPAAVGRLVDYTRRSGATSARDGMALCAILSAQLAVEQLIRHPGRIHS